MKSLGKLYSDKDLNRCFENPNREISKVEEYYNALDIEGFSRMMKDPSYSYKFYWLEAIVQLISENKTKASYDEIIDEMIANAWYSVIEFHIHLSGIFAGGDSKDNLERAVIKLHKLSGLQSNVSKIQIKNAIKQFKKELHEEKCGIEGLQDSFI